MLLTMWGNVLILAQDSAGGDLCGGIGGILGCGCCFLFLIGFALLPMIGMFKAFTKAGEPGWKAFLPITAMMTIAKMAGKEDEAWMAFIPLLNSVKMIIWSMAVAERFGKGGGFGIGLVFVPFICWPILGFGSAQYSARGRN